MSIFLGTYNQAQMPLTDKGLSLMYDAVKKLPHEKYSEIVQKHIAFGHLLTYNTPESVFEVQPQMQDNNLFVSVGRIDNREILAKKLKIPINETLPDGKIMQLAFIRYGLACVNHFKGDWAFAAYDFKSKELHLARCPMGYMSLYYTQIGEEFYFSNAIKPMIKAKAKDLKINEAKFLSNYTFLGALNNLNMHTTIFQDINCVPMGSTLTLTKNTKLTNRYWQPENIKEDYSTTKDEVNKRMEELFIQATKRRLRSYKPVASMLSGGLDSSTVSFVAAEIMKEEGERLMTFSHVPLFKSEMKKDQSLAINKKYQLDESLFIMATANKSGNIDAQLLNSENYSLLKGMDTILDVFDGPIHAAANAYWMIDIFQTVSAQGYGTLLSGEGGNGSISFSAINHFLSLTLHRITKNPKQTLKILIAKKNIYKYFYTVLKKIRGNEIQKYGKSSHLKSELFQRLKNSLSPKDKNEDFVKNYQHIKELKLHFVDMYQIRSDYGSLAGQYFGIELRDPTTDQDLMEFFFSIPNEFFFDEGFEGRMLVKRMMQGKLPDEVLYTTKKGVQSADMTFRINRENKEIKQRYELLKNHKLVTHYFELDKKPLESQKADYMNEAMNLKTMHFSDFLVKYF
jgi:asparagine synthase (glutamine-hydrolysing)